MPSSASRQLRNAARGIVVGKKHQMDMVSRRVQNAFSGKSGAERTDVAYLDKSNGEKPGSELPGLVFWLQRV